MDELNIDDPQMWHVIHHGSVASLEAVAIDLVNEVRRQRERVATLEAELSSARRGGLALNRIQRKCEHSIVIVENGPRCADCDCLLDISEETA